MNEQDLQKCKAMVESHVKRFAKRTPAHIEEDDIRGAAYVGLMEAEAKFNTNLGWKFNTFASHRVKGAILDYLRALDWVPRETRRRTFELDRAYKAAAQELGSTPDDEAVAAAAGLDLPSYHEAVAATQHRAVTSLDSSWTADDMSAADVIADVKAENPERAAGDRMFLARAMARLNASETAVIEGCDLGGATLKEVAAGMGVTESRACQVRRAAYKKMRAAA